MNKSIRIKLTGFLLVALITSLCQQEAEAYYTHTEKINTEISGTVLDAASGEPLAGVNIRVKDKRSGTSTNGNGEFSLTVNEDPPVVLIFSIVGFKSTEVVVDETPAQLTVELQEATLLGDEVVVSASRVEENILEAPVSIEKLDAIAIQESASPSFYESLANLKGVDFSTQSITFKSVNTRGFNANGNTRFVQLIDGIDNQAPGLNFPVGNVVGISDIDLESAELIPGVASALYGPNAINGILLLESKGPFDYQGLSANITTGLNHFDSNVEDNPQFYQDYALRFADVINERFGYKFTFSYLNASDFVAQDTRDQGPQAFGAVERGETSRNGNRVYNGVNVYGQPLLTIGQIADGLITGGNQDIAAIRSLLPDGEAGAFTPTGYNESSFVENESESLKMGGALHYLLNDDLELLGQFNYGKGSTVYTANDRFVLDNFSIYTAKTELKSSNFFVRAYLTRENAGNTYAANTIASLINVGAGKNAPEELQEIPAFIPTYFRAFAGARTQGATVEEAHGQARVAGEQAQPQPGSENFEKLFNYFRGLPISEGGAKFLDESGLLHAETSYNFSNIVDPSTLEIIAGGNVRRYDLKSEGTLFALRDDGEEFNIDEFGAYVQLSKDVLDDKLDLQGSLRYDKNEFFEGQLSPRLSAVYTVAGDHNIRASFQRGFRIPATQTQFIDLDVVTRRLIGSNPVLVDRYNFETNTVYRTESVNAARDALAQGQNQQAARQLLQPVQFEDLKTEKVSTFEIGYKSLINDRFLIDGYYYYSSYSDFIAEIDFTQGVPNGLREDPGNFNPDSEDGQDDIINRTVPTQRYGFDVNAGGTVEAQGFALGLEYILSGGYTIGGNVAFNNLISQEDLEDQGFRANYNTPEWRYNLSFKNRNLTENIGFNIVYRWQDAFLWEASFGSGIIVAYGTLDAQISYKLSDLNTRIKLSGSNLLNDQHTTSFGNPRLGAIYLLSFTFDQFLN